MPIPIQEDTVKLTWENNPDTPITSSNLAKDLDYVASYRDFDLTPPLNAGSTIFSIDPTNNMRLVMKREVIIGVINREVRIAINNQYKAFDNGLEDLYIRIEDMDDNPGNPTGSWGANNEWFIYLCDAENGISGQLIVSQNRTNPIDTQVLGNPTYYYSSENTRIIGGFKSNASGEIIANSVWDIAGKFHIVKAKHYYVLDENANLTSDFNRHLYRRLTISDLDTSNSSYNTIDADLTINADLYATDLHVDTLNSNNIDSNSGTIDTINVTNAFIDTANITDLNVTNLNVAVSNPLFDGSIVFKSNTSYNGTLQHSNTDHRTWSFPNNSGTVSMNRTSGDSDFGAVRYSGAVLSPAGQFYGGGDAPAATTRLNYNGYFYATRVYNAVYNDLAEYFKSADQELPGRIYSINNEGLLVLANNADKNVVGVCSDSYAFVMKDELKKEGGIPIALAGTVKVSTRYEIRTGDEIVSDHLGFGRKANLFHRIFNRRAIIGKALESNKDKQENRILVKVY
jgi:hypothetical protein